MSSEPIIYIKGSEKRDITVEALQIEMAQWLQSDNLNFLIGAGCSSYISDGKELGIPSMTNLYKDFLEKKSDFLIGNKPINGKFDNSLEKMLEVMQAIDIVNKLENIDENINDKITIVQKFLRDKIKQGLKENKVLDIYKNFYLRTAQKPRKSPINIFTTNYDLYNEIALDELGFSYNNGFTGTYKRKFNPISYNYMYVENMNLNHDVWEGVSTFYNLIKIHGSISWVKSNQEIWEQDYEKINDNETVMIYPTPLKDRTTLMTPYSDLFRCMEDRLMKKNSTLIVIGYSFSDEHINRIILNGLGIPTFKLVVFGKSNNIDRLKKYSDTRITIINSTDKIHYFTNIINEVMPSIHPDILEEEYFNSSNNIAK